jgi:hypothetical protein
MGLDFLICEKLIFFKDEQKVTLRVGLSVKKLTVAHTARLSEHNNNWNHEDGSLTVQNIEAVRTSETLGKSYLSKRRYNPEDSHLHTHRGENLKSHLAWAPA